MGKHTLSEAQDALRAAKKAKLDADNVFRGAQRNLAKAIEKHHTLLIQGASPDAVKEAYQDLQTDRCVYYEKEAFVEAAVKEIKERTATVQECEAALARRRDLRSPENRLERVRTKSKVLLRDMVFCHFPQVAAAFKTRGWRIEAPAANPNNMTEARRRLLDVTVDQEAFSYHQVLKDDEIFTMFLITSTENGFLVFPPASPAAGSNGVTNTNTATTTTTTNVDDDDDTETENNNETED